MFFELLAEVGCVVAGVMQKLLTLVLIISWMVGTLEDFWLLNWRSA